MRDLLIKILGGVPAAEARQSYVNSAEVSAYHTLEKLRTYAKSLNGLPAEEWCRKMYDHINEEIKKYVKENN